MLTGQRLWSVKTGHWVISSPIVTRDLVIFGSSDGHLYGVHAHGTPRAGAIAFRFLQGPTGQLSGSPLVTPEAIVCVP